MAILWMDGFAHYKASGATSAIDITEFSGAYQGTTTNGTRIYDEPTLGSFAIQGVLGPATASTFEWPLPSTKNTGKLGVGFHTVITAQMSSSAYTMPLVGFRNVSTSLVSLNLNNNGNLQIGTTNGTSASALATGTTVLSTNTKYHIEVLLTLSASAASSKIEVRLDGSPELSYTPPSTPYTAVTRIGLCDFFNSALSGVGSRWITNLYIWDETGSVNNDWMGERNVYTLRPDSDSSDQDWSLSTGSDAYDLLDDTPDTPSTRYISSSTVGDRSQFGIDDLPSSDITVNAVMPVYRGLKTGTALTELNIGVQTNSVDSAATAIPIAQNQSTWCSTIIEENPDTSAQWDPSEINALETYVIRAS